MTSRYISAIGMGGLLLGSAPAWACRVCRPRVQAGIHTPDYQANLLVLLLPVGLLVLLGLLLYFAPTLQRRPGRPSLAPHA